MYDVIATAVTDMLVDRLLELGQPPELATVIRDKAEGRRSGLLHFASQVKLGDHVHNIVDVVTTDLVKMEVQIFGLRRTEEELVQGAEMAIIMLFVSVSNAHGNILGEAFICPN